MHSKPVWLLFAANTFARFKSQAIKALSDKAGQFYDQCIISPPSESGCKMTKAFFQVSKHFGWVKMRLPQTFPLIFSLSLSHDRPSATQIRHSSTGLEPGWGLCDTKFSDLSFNLAMHSTFYLALLLLSCFYLSSLQCTGLSTFLFPLLQIVLLKKMYFCIDLIDHVGWCAKPMASNSLMLKLYPMPG